MFTLYLHRLAIPLHAKAIVLCGTMFYAVNAFAVVDVRTNVYYTANANGLTWKYHNQSTGDCRGNKIVGKYWTSYTYKSLGMTPWQLTSVGPIEAAIGAQTAGAVTVPTKLANKTITGIDAYAFYNCTNLTVITIPSTITNIEATAFWGCSKNLKVVFLGNAPAAKCEWPGLAANALNGTAYVMPTSTGWDVDIPGKWCGMSIDYLKCVKFNANGGMVVADDRYIADGEAIGTLPTPSHTDCDFVGWFTKAEGGDMISSSTTVTGNKTYYAHWVDAVPIIPSTASAEIVSESLSGSADKNLIDKVNTGSKYNLYRQWIVDNLLSHKAVRDSTNAWLSYALDAPGLINKSSAVAKEDFTFAAGSAVAEEPGKMTFDFGIDGVTIGEEAELDEVFVITGAETLEESEFTELGVTALFARTSDGKVSVVAEPPKDDNGKIPDTYFFRVKLK